MSEKDEPIRWEVGERVINDAVVVPGAFLFFYAGVLAWKWCVRALRRAASALRPRRQLLPPPLKALPPPRAAEPGSADC